MRVHQQQHNREVAARAAAADVMAGVLLQGNVTAEELTDLGDLVASTAVGVVPRRVLAMNILRLLGAGGVNHLSPHHPSGAADPPAAAAASHTPSRSPSPVGTEVAARGAPQHDVFTRLTGPAATMYSRTPANIRRASATLRGTHAMAPRGPPLAPGSASSSPLGNAGAGTPATPAGASDTPRVVASSATVANAGVDAAAKEGDADSDVDSPTRTLVAGGAAHRPTSSFATVVACIVATTWRPPADDIVAGAVVDSPDGHHRRGRRRAFAARGRCCC
jgi:hypothetical protein